jgi:hypothetical protein
MSISNYAFWLCLSGDLSYWQVRRSLRTMREKNDVRGVLGVLEVCVRGNFAGTESARLYSEVN